MRFLAFSRRSIASMRSASPASTIRAFASFQQGAGSTWQSQQGQVQSQSQGQGRSYNRMDEQAPIEEGFNQRTNAPASVRPSVPSSGVLLPFVDDGLTTEVVDFKMASEPFSSEIQAILAEPINPAEIEIKPDGVCYLPEIKYRKLLFRAFGSGGWYLIPRGPHSQSGLVLSREYALICHGRFVSQARGSTSIASFSNAALSSEAVRSNALMRCCKDLGIASELWDGHFIQAWKDNYAVKRTVNDPSGRAKILWSKRVD